MTGQYKFGNNERLSNRKHISFLFESGSSFHVNLLKVLYKVTLCSDKPEIRIIVALPKRKFKRAIDRNHIRRLIKEAYRLNKSILTDRFTGFPVILHIGFTYTGSNLKIPFAKVEEQMKFSLEKLGRILLQGMPDDISPSGGAAI
jgi:ribonuclease P protein component